MARILTTPTPTTALAALLLAAGATAGALRAADAALAAEVRAVAESTGTVRLDWIDLPDEPGYRVERSRDLATWQTVVELPANTTSHLDTGLAAGGWYAYRVLRSDAPAGGVAVAWHFAVTKRTVAANTPGPLLVQATFTPTGAVAVTWSDDFSSTGITYRVERAVGTGAYAFLAQTTAPERAVTDGGPFLTDTAYRYRVSAEIGATRTAWTETTAKVAQLTPLTIPALYDIGGKLAPNLAAPAAVTVNALGTAGVEVSWEAVAGATGYQVLASRGGPHAFVVADTTGAAATSARVEGLDQDAGWRFRVVAIDSAYRLSPPSTDIARAPLPFATSLPPPSAVTSEFAAGVQTVRWTPPADLAAPPTGFHVELLMDNGRYARAGTVAADAASWIAPSTGLRAARVQTIRDDEASLYAYASSPPAKDDAVSAPTGLAVSVVGPTRVDLSWTNPVSLTGTVVERSVEGGAFQPLIWCSLSQTSFRDYSVSPGKAYRYRVVAYSVHTGRRSPAIETAVITPPAANAAPSIPTGFTAVGAAPDQVTLGWTTPPGAEGVRVQRSVDGGATFETIAERPATATSWSDLGRTAGASTRYRAQTWNSAGASAWTSVLTATTPATAPAVAFTERTWAGRRTLVITGTSRDDDIRVAQDGADLLVSHQGGAPVRRAGPFVSVEVRGGAGDDTLVLGASVSVGGSVYPGDGDDVVRIDSSARFTAVCLGGGLDRVVGNGLNTSYWVDDAMIDTVEASVAEIDAGRVHRVRLFHQPTTFDPAAGGYVHNRLTGITTADPGFHGQPSFISRYSGNPLFVGPPQVADVDQGFHQDCPLTSFFQSVALTRPEILEEIVADLGDGSYAVQTAGGAYLRFDADMAPTMVSRPGPSGALWWLVLEKAFYTGYVAAYPFALREAELPLQLDEETLAARIVEALRARRIVGMWNRGTAVLDAPLIRQGHRYSFVGVTRFPGDPRPRFLARNPYGQEFYYHNSPSDPAQGFVTLTADEVRNNLYFAGTAEIAPDVFAQAPRTALERWTNTHFGPNPMLALAAPMADADDDGLANLVEYATGADPLTRDTVTPLAAEIMDGGLRLSYPLAKTATDAIVRVETSDTLAPADWRPADVQEVAIVDLGDTWRVTVRDLDWDTERPRCFYRLRVELP